MGVQRQYGNTRIRHIEILAQRLMEDTDFLHYGFLGYRLRHVADRQMCGHQSHAKHIIHQNHQCLPAFPGALLYIFRMSGEMETVALNRRLVDRRRHQYVEQPLAIIRHSPFQSSQSRLAALGRRLSEIDLHLVRQTVHQIQAPLHGLIRFLYRDEICRQFHRLTVVSGHFRRTIYNRCTQLQHHRFAEKLQDNLVSHTVYVTVGYPHQDLTILHIFRF